MPSLASIFRSTYAMKKLTDNSFCENQGLAILEGYRAIVDAHNSGAELLRVVYSNEALIDKIKSNTKGILNNLYLHVKPHDLSQITNLSSSPGVIGIFRRVSDGQAPGRKLSNIIKEKPRLYLICDKIQDPTNLGVIIRSAALSGVSSLITTKETIDSWHPKVLRSSSASNFFIPIYNKVSWEVAVSLVSKNAQWLISEPHTKDHTLNKISYDKVDWAKNDNIVVIGNEATGVSQEIISFCQSLKKNSNSTEFIEPKVVFIPTREFQSSLDSLNASTAASILCFEALKHQITLKM